MIAGNRRFPILFAEAAKRHGVFLVAVAIKGETSAALKRHADRLFWLSLGEFDRLVSIFKNEGISKVAMAGQISPARLFGRQVRQSAYIQSLLRQMRDWRANTIFGSIADKLKEQGIELIDSTTFLDDCMPAAGVLGQRQPGPEEWEDIRFGYALAKKIADLDVGLTVGVKHKAIVGVEALEGTDNLIRRAGRIARSGLTVVKVGRTGQDMRFDIPVIGVQTVKTLIRSRASCLAVEAGSTIFLDRQEAIRLADAQGIAVVAV